MGRIFYVDHNTGTTTWTSPAESPNVKKSKAAKRIQDSWKEHKKRQREKIDMDAMQLKSLNLGLPEGWEMRLHPVSKRPFYLNHKTKETTWVHPLQAKIQSPQIKRPLSATYRATPSLRLAARALPPPWEQKVDDQGRIYFVNHKTKTSQWTDPRIL